LGIPGALLGAWAMMAQQRTFREHAMPQFGRDLVWAATALLLYGVIGQIFVRETALVPSNLVNSTLFLQWFGIPVQLFRGIMAAILALTMIRALNAFELENQRRLSAADQAKIQAQAESLEAERRTSQERERLNWELRQTTRELALLLDLSNLLATSMKLQDRLEAVMQRLVHSLSFPDAGMILLFEPPMDSLHLRAVSGFSQPEDDGWKAWSREVGERCALEGQVVCRHLDGETLALPFAEALTEPKCHLYASPITVLGLPLFVQEKVIGSLVLTQSEGAADGGVTVEELELILGIAQQLGLSIENARLSQEAQEREQMLGNLLHQVVDAQESERQRIARELHDATGQSLTAIALGLRGLEGMLEVGEDEPEAVVGQIRELKSFGTTALGELRQIIADLRPSILDDMGLAAALKWYVDSFQKRRSVPSTFVLEGDPVRLRSEFETVLFRIAQEALTNIAKYAAATQVTVTLCFAPPQVSLVVEDNGRGFEPRNVLQRQGNLTGWGLLGIQERASLLGGQYIIDSAPGQGTRVWVSVPMVQETLELDHDDHTSPAG
jgi:signal transduction histidine kinase